MRSIYKKMNFNFKIMKDKGTDRHRILVAVVVCLHANTRVYQCDYRDSLA